MNHDDPRAPALPRRPIAKKLLPHPWLTLSLMLIWVVMNNSFSLGQWILGLFLGWLIALIIGEGLWLRAVRINRPHLLLVLTFHVLVDIVIANLQVARLVLGSTAKLRPAFIEIPLDVEHELGLTLLITAISLSPGTLCAEVSDDHRRLLIHVLDLENEAELVALIKRRYETPLMEVFQCSQS